MTSTVPASRPAQTDDELLAYLDRCFARHGTRSALRRETDGGGEQLSFAELRGRIAALTALLRTVGVTDGARVALLCENRPEWVIAFLGVLGAGGTVVPLDTKLATNELGVLLGHAEPRVILTSHAQRGRVQEALRGRTVRVLLLEDE